MSTVGYLVDEGQGGLGSTQYATALVLDAGRPVVVGANYRYPDSDGLIDTMIVRLEFDAIFTTDRPIPPGPFVRRRRDRRSRPRPRPSC